jgi:hypothetical protein
VRSVEFHPEAQDEFVSAAQFYEDRTKGLGLDFIRTIQGTYERLLDFSATGARSVAASGAFWSQSFPTAFCIASSLTASTSSRSCTFTVGQATGVHVSETLLPNNRLERSGSTPAAQPGRSTTGEDRGAMDATPD